MIAPVKKVIQVLNNWGLVMKKAVGLHVCSEKKPEKWKNKGKYSVLLSSFDWCLIFFPTQIKCIDQVEHRGLAEVGIYRVPG